MASDALDLAIRESIVSLSAFDDEPDEKVRYSRVYADQLVRRVMKKEVLLGEEESVTGTSTHLAMFTMHFSAKKSSEKEKEQDSNRVLLLICRHSLNNEMTEVLDESEKRTISIPAYKYIILHQTQEQEYRIHTKDLIRNIYKKLEAITPTMPEDSLLPVISKKRIYVQHERVDVEEETDDATLVVALLDRCEEILTGSM